MPSSRNHRYALVTSPTAETMKKKPMPTAARQPAGNHSTPSVNAAWRGK